MMEMLHFIQHNMYIVWFFSDDFWWQISASFVCNTNVLGACNVLNQSSFYFFTIIKIRIIKAVFKCWLYYLIFFFVGQSLARLSGILLKATRRCLPLQERSDGKQIFQNKNKKMLLKVQGLESVAGLAAVSSVTDCPLEGCTVN